MSTFTIVLVSFILGHEIPILLSSIVNYVLKKRLMKSILPGKVNKKRLCKTPHSWIKTKTWNERGDVDVRVCRVCGFIEGTENMVSIDSIDSIEENGKIRELEERIYRNFVEREDGDIKRYFAQEIQGGLNLEKLFHIHTAGMTFNQRYAIYKASRAEEIKKELTKSDA